MTAREDGRVASRGLAGPRAGRQVAARARDLVGRWYAIPLLLCVWQFFAGSGLVHSRLLPGLGDITRTLAADLWSGVLIHHAAVTVGRALVGFLLAATVGIPLAVAMARSAVTRNLFEPIFVLGYPVPKIALFPVFTYIFGLGTSSKIAFTFLECVYPIVVTSYLGFRAIPSRLVWTAQNYGAGRWTILSRILVPAALPSVFAGLRIALPIAIVIVILTEMIGDSVGLGFYVSIWSTRFSFEHVYAAILLIGILGLLLDQGLLQLRRIFLHWEKEPAR